MMIGVYYLGHIWGCVQGRGGGGGARQHSGGCLLLRSSGNSNKHYSHRLRGVKVHTGVACCCSQIASSLCGLQGEGTVCSEGGTGHPQQLMMGQRRGAGE